VKNVKTGKSITPNQIMEKSLTRVRKLIMSLCRDLHSWNSFYNLNLVISSNHAV